MTMIRRLRYAPEAATGLCATCSWGTVRTGFRENEAEAFCRLVGPNSRCAVRGPRMHRLLRPPRPDDPKRSPLLWLRHRDSAGCG